MSWKRILRIFFPARPSGVTALRHQARARRVAVARKEAPMLRVQAATAPRPRRGRLMHVPSAWRRLALGTNNISAFGIWRVGSRRARIRANRTGETRWHRPHRASFFAPSFSWRDE